MNTARLIRAVAFFAVVLLGSALGGSASARSLTTGPLVEHFDGTSWSQVAVPSIQYGLDAVVAPSATDVWAFGVSSVALHWDGTSWRRVTLPTPPHSNAPGFWGASAVAPHDVWAVGNVSPAHAPEHGIIDHWNGRRWQLVPFTVPRSELYGIAALSANDVWAVGDATVSTSSGYERLALTLHWNGTKWKQVASPNPAPSSMPSSSVQNILSAVAGSSSHDVWAVGQYYLWANGVRGSRALMLHWNGSSWKIVPSPDLVAKHVSFLNGVAAPSATGAWTVGGINRRNAQGALALRLKDGRWGVVRVNGPRLAGVSALAADDAWAAAGAGFHAAPGRVMHWNGHLWSLATKLDSRLGLGAVAEISPTDVWAVGGRFTR